MAGEGTPGKSPAKKWDKRDNLRPPWKPGQSGNPKGRAKGVRNKLSESVFADILKDWDAHGPEAIERVRQASPDVYLRVVASMLPKQMDVQVSQLEELTDEQLREQLERVARDLGSLAAFGIAGDVAGGEAQTRH